MSETIQAPYLMKCECCNNGLMKLVGIDDTELTYYCEHCKSYKTYKRKIHRYRLAYGDRDVIIDEKEKDSYTPKYEGFNRIINTLNRQEDEINYWKSKVSSLLFILTQFDENKVEELIQEIEKEEYQLKEE